MASRRDIAERPLSGTLQSAGFGTVLAIIQPVMASTPEMIPRAESCSRLRTWVAEPKSILLGPPRPPVPAKAAPIFFRLCHATDSARNPRVHTALQPRESCRPRRSCRRKAIITSRRSIPRRSCRGSALRPVLLLRGDKSPIARHSRGARGGLAQWANRAVCWLQPWYQPAGRPNARARRAGVLASLDMI